MKLWMVGKFVSEHDTGIVWDFMGIYLFKKSAVKACVDHEDYFVGPVVLGETLPDERENWEGCYYPYERSEVM